MNQLMLDSTEDKLRFLASPEFAEVCTGDMPGMDHAYHKFMQDEYRDTKFRRELKDSHDQR